MSKDLTSGLFWLAIAIFFAADSFARLKLGTLHQPGPGFFPFWAGVALALLSLISLFRSLKKRDMLSLCGLKSSKLLLVTGALLAYLLLLDTLGFLTVTFLFLLLLFRLEYRRWGFSAVLALIGAGSCFAIFQLWLKTQLPAGPFGF
ncbi:MAG TPA: tripartite tricarboxylate transporter TctB family protein [Candidatus Binatia bacterium]|nr:tripartite tricarboxylate transporter TctB family protein [Candidatus Binatia bacterium]